MSVRIDVGDGVRLEVVTFGQADGPVLAVLGGVHGDELEGILAARIFAGQLARGAIPGLRGQVRVLAVSNPVAHAARSRTTPGDGGNLARVFPGRDDGSLTERLAHAITTEIIGGSDLLVDLHSAGARYQMPVFAGFVAAGSTGERSSAAAAAFSAPVTWEHATSGPGRSLSAAEHLGVPSMYVEGSGGGGLIGHDLDIYVAGLQRLLHWLGMVDGPAPAGRTSMVLKGGDGNVDASLACTVDGYCVTRAQVGAVVAEGCVLAEILDGGGDRLQQIRANRAGTLMMLRRQADVTAGDGIAMLGPVPEGWAA